MIITEHKPNLQKCITELKKLPHNRDVQIIIDYVSTLNYFMDLIKGELLRDPEHLKLTCKIMKYIHKEKDEIIIKEGEKGDEFFLILKGKVSILLIKSYEYLMSEEEYILHLFKLRKNDQHELLKQTIKLNLLKFPVEENFDLFIRNLVNHKTKGGVYLDNLKIMKGALEVFNHIKTENNLTKRFISPKEYIKMNKVDVEKLSEFEKFQQNNINKKKVLICNFELVNYLETGRTFGDKALDNYNNKRTATVFSSESTDFAVIKQREYNLLIKNAIEKTKKIFFSFIYSYNIFSDVSRYLFEKRYYNFFTYKKFPKLTKLIIENEPIDKLFFIINGEYEINTTKNIYEINETIIYLKNTLLKIKNSFKKIPEFNPEKEQKENEDLLLNKKFRTENENEKIFEKKFIKLGIFNIREIMGLKDCIKIDSNKNFGLFNCICSSFEGEVYEFPYSRFVEMLKWEKGVKDYTNELEIKKILLIIQRLIYHKNSVYNKIKIKDLEESSFYYNQYLNQKKISSQLKIESNMFLNKTCDLNGFFEKIKENSKEKKIIHKKKNLSLNFENEKNLNSRNTNVLSLPFVKSQNNFNSMSKFSNLITFSDDNYINNREIKRNALDKIFRSSLNLNTERKKENYNKIENLKTSKNFKSNRNNFKLNIKLFNKENESENKKDDDFLSPSLKIKPINFRKKIKPKLKVNTYDALIMDKIKIVYNNEIQKFKKL